MSLQMSLVLIGGEITLPVAVSKICTTGKSLSSSLLLRSVNAAANREPSAVMATQFAPPYFEKRGCNRSPDFVSHAPIQYELAKTVWLPSAEIAAARISLTSNGWPMTASVAASRTWARLDRPPVDV